MKAAALLSAMFGIALLTAGSSVASAASPYQSSPDFTKYAMKLRESALLNLEPKVLVPTSSRPLGFGGDYPWKKEIVATVFWAGESASQNNPVHNRSSSWDANWATSFGGYDDPSTSNRIANGKDYRPAKFIPQQNPFYVALPYNDVTRGTTKPEVRMVIPWFKKEWKKEGESICHDRWLEIRNPANGRKCFAQWGDCGPFRTDHWQYVFGNERPKPNLNKGAGLDVSPSVRDYLGIGSIATLDWRFVEFRDVARGPWSMYGDNNDFVQQGRQNGGRVASAKEAEPKRPAEAPRVMTK